MALLEVRDVTVQFGGLTALRSASFEVPEGQVIGLMGPNGAGKTTLFNVITGLQEPTSGSVWFHDKDITKLHTRLRARAGIGRTFQRLEVFGSLSVRENVLVAAEMHKLHRRDAARPEDTCERLLDLVGLRNFADVPADAVPTGIARLTELARALATDPTLVLLDEPSSGLNEEETHEFANLVTRLAAEGTSVLLVEHDVELIMSLCSLIHVLDFGEIIFSGTPSEVKSDQRVQDAYLGTDTPSTDAAVLL